MIIIWIPWEEIDTCNILQWYYESPDSPGTHCIKIVIIMDNNLMTKNSHNDSQTDRQTKTLR